MDTEEIEVPVKIGAGTVVHRRAGPGQTYCGLGSSKLWHDETIMPIGTPITCKKCTTKEFDILRAKVENKIANSDTMPKLTDEQEGCYGQYDGYICVKCPSDHHASPCTVAKECRIRTETNFVIEVPPIRTKTQAIDVLKAVWQDMLKFQTPSNDVAVNESVDALRQIVHALESDE